ncbi:MAG TPA: hypothetical protein PKE57_12110 [Cellvibrionaceae bacterium]|nr:hypothetical protein [Cellvibrionaceae bacterium]HMW47337.1 hypothetical protein [Cellvibrionaceae bacterium]HMY39684.1 hypothetical protein [Marinagarivorans sp.]HNG60155.1 hypothetical protein [Cellvibrionaceae bacterium]
MGGTIEVDEPLLVADSDRRNILSALANGQAAEKLLSENQLGITARRGEVTNELRLSYKRISWQTKNNTIN